jgi:(p)ppGpp synthase/HD superfamily hydrolase
MSREAPDYPLKVHKALEFAARAHEGKYRKNKDEQIPYFSHCAAVALLLARAGFDEDTVAAGALHDTIEDEKVPRQALAAQFGEQVAELVDWVTEQDKSLDWEVRKARYLERLEQAPREAVAISCADKIHNLWSLLIYKENGQDVWAIVKRGRAAQLDRLDRIAKLYRERVDPPLEDLFEKALERVKAEC